MKFRKKPVVIEAKQFTVESSPEISKWIGDSFAGYGTSGGRIQTVDMLFINTLEGKMTALIDDWIIRGVKGEFYPCKPDIFEATYEAVGE